MECLLVGGLGESSGGGGMYSGSLTPASNSKSFQKKESLRRYEISRLHPAEFELSHQQGKTGGVSRQSSDRAILLKLKKNEEGGESEEDTAATRGSGAISAVL